MSCGNPFDYFGEEPEELAYVSAPYSKWETVKVRCPTCGGGHKMPMDGPCPLDEKGEIDWDVLMPFITRFAQGLSRACTLGPTNRPCA